MSSNKVVIFGGAGFLGSTVADIFSDAGYLVHIYDLSPSKYLRHDQIMIVGNIDDKEMVDQAIRGSQYVLSFAAIADIAEANLNPERTMHVNILGTINILNSCVKNKVQKFIFASTIYVYGNKGGFYRVSKQACEKIIEEYFEQFGLNYCVLRFGSLYGPRANAFNSIKNFIKQAMLEGKITRNSNGKETRSYIYVVDAAKLVLKTIDPEYDQKHVIITGNEKMYISDILEMIAEIFENKIAIEYQSGEIKGHYKTIPHTYKPKIAVSLIPNEFYDIGQGLVEVIHEVENEIYSLSHNLRIHEGSEEAHKL